MNLTGAVTAVSMDKVLGERPVTNITTALQGAVPGLTFQRMETMAGYNRELVRKSMYAAWLPLMVMEVLLS